MLRTSCVARTGIIRNHLRHTRVLCPYSTSSKTDGAAKRPKAVIFDMGGVLLPSPAGIFREFEASQQLPTGTIIRAVIDNGSEGAWYKLEEGKLSTEEFIKPFSAEVSEKAGKQVDVTEMISEFNNMNKVRPYPFVLDAIRCIKAEGIKTAMLTNNWFGKDRKSYQPIDKSLFDVIIESCVVGVRKPNPGIYEICLKQLGVQPHESIFLDDIGQNLKAAKALGINTIKVDDPEKAIAELEQILGFPLRGYAAGTCDVPSRLQIPKDKLSQYLQQAVQPGAADEIIVRLFAHGQSNPTYFVKWAGRNLVLRKKPPGKLLPSAHAVDREYKVMKSLGHQGVPVPKMLAFCDDDSILGTPFYVMEYVTGRVITDSLLKDVAKENRREVYSSMIDVLCKIHSVNISDAKLEDYGKQGNFVKRNFSRWARQYEASKTHEIPSMIKLLEWIPNNLPKDERVTVVHGDFRLDNLILHPERSEVLAVLDWELSTIGDPLTDLASCCGVYYMPKNILHFRGFGDTDLVALGIPTVEELVGEYCQRLNIPPITNWNFYIAYNFFRMAAIIQGVYKRSLAGQSTSAKVKVLGTYADALADVGWKYACKQDQAHGGSHGNGPIENRRHYSTLGKNNTAAQVTEKMSTITESMPVSVASLSPRVQDLHKKVKAFIEKELIPLEGEYAKHAASAERWTVPRHLEEVKAKAKSQGLWNLFLPRDSDPGGKFGAGLSNVEYAFLCEEMGKCVHAPEAFNCSAPDTGNMEVLVRYGTPEQQEKWLKPLLEGKIRSCFAMTEPAVASSDATNIQSSIRRDGDDYVINGHKWWTSGALDPRCKICVFMGKTSKSGATYNQQSMILVPMDSPGIKIVRPLSVFGFEDPPAGHGEVTFENVRVPASNILLGEGKGFEIAQGRLGPGRIHHCMRLIGNSERALALMVERTQNRIAFGLPLSAQGTIQADVAQSRIEIEQTRLLVLKAAHMMDTVGNKIAAPEIAMIKVAAPNMALRVIDRAIQAFGGAGVSMDTPLAILYTHARTLRLADGPDEVHRRAIAKSEYRKGGKGKL